MTGLMLVWKWRDRRRRESRIAAGFQLIHVVHMFSIKMFICAYFILMRYTVKCLWSSKTAQPLFSTIIENCSTCDNLLSSFSRVNAKSASQCVLITHCSFIHEYRALRVSSPTAPHLPYRVQHIPVLKYPEQFVVCGDFVKVGPLLVREEQIWFPYGV